MRHKKRPVSRSLTPSILEPFSFQSFRQSFPVILGQCFASTFHRCHVITISTDPLVFFGWLPRMPPGILNSKNDDRQDDGGQHGGDDQCVGHCVTLCVVVFSTVNIIGYSPRYVNRNPVIL